MERNGWNESVAMFRRIFDGFGLNRLNLSDLTRFLLVCFFFFGGFFFVVVVLLSFLFSFSR